MNADMHTALGRAAREWMRAELKRYHVPEGTHVSLDEVLTPTEGVIEMRLTRINGLGVGATWDEEVLRIPAAALTSPSRVMDLLRGGVRSMVAKMFGVHEGEGLP